MATLIALIAGLVFGAGLMVSGMANPAKVQGFLDLAGNFDPSLAFVMAGAVIVGSIAFFIVKRRMSSFLGLTFQLPGNTVVSRRLVLGSAAFGIGWGLAGFCPGPALVALGEGYPKAIGFVAAMVTGMFVFELLERASSKALARSQ